MPIKAHETRPAIGDLIVGNDAVSLTLRLVLEAPLAGIDLDGLDDTNDAPEAAQYDRLRQIPPAQLAARARAAWQDMAPLIRLESNGQILPLSLDHVTVEDEPNPELPRESLLHVSARLPAGSAPVTFSWDPSLGPIALRQQGAGADGYTGYLTGGASSAPIPRGGGHVETPPLQTALNYFVIGFEHILPLGLDHILFVLGLFFFSTQIRPLLVQVTAFTVAHTATLALATFGMVSLSSAVVEPLIAASIAYIAAENIFLRRVTPWRTVVIFVFGLLHGLGFASVLGEIGLSTGQTVLSLVAFNIGVEFGQLTVIALAYLAVGLWFGRKEWYHRVIAVPASVAIGIIGTYWFLERVGAIPA